GGRVAGPLLRERVGRGGRGRGGGRAALAPPPGAQPPGALRGGEARGEARRRGGGTSARRRPPSARSHHKRTRPSTSPNVSSRIARTPVAASAPIRPSVVTATAVGVPLTLYSSSTSEPC